MTVAPEKERDWKRRLKALGLSRRRVRGGAPPRPTAPHVLRGRDGEEAAAAFLAAKGARVLARNVRYGDGEIDLVAQCDGALVFVEVKRRRDSSRGDAAQCVTPLKRARILRAARRWLAENPSREERAVRFDVVAIEDAPPRVDWIQGAFDASS
jgi:putative endonuclease